MDQIAAVTVGEKPQEMTFRNVVVAYPQRPRRTYPEHWDRMMERPGLDRLSAGELGTPGDQNRAGRYGRARHHPRMQPISSKRRKAVMLSQNPPGGIIMRRSPVGTLALDAPTCARRSAKPLGAGSVRPACSSAR